MNFEQSKKKFEKLKAEFAAGTVSEARFKTELEELMLQDEQGSWWMIGYETEKWYRHNGKDWVQTDPPGTRARKSTPPPLNQEIGTNIPRTNPDEQRSLWKFGKKEIIQSAIGLGVFTLVYFLPGGRSVSILIGSYWSLAFAVPLFFGVVFGPIVGVGVGAGGYIISTVFKFFENRYYYSPFYFDYFSSIALLGFAVAGFIMGFAKGSSSNFRSFKSILRVELFILLAYIARLLFSPDLRYLFDPSYSERFGVWSSLVWSFILVPISLVVYSFILSRRQTGT